MNDEEMDWESMVFKLTKDEILWAVKDVEWQMVRRQMKGKKLRVKYMKLKNFLENRNDDRAKICVANYINALKRGGLID